jgi:MFS family permease
MVTGPTVMAILFTVMGIAGVLCQGVLVGRFIALFGERKTIFIGLATSAASFFLLLLAPELISLMFFASTLYVGIGLVTPCINGLVSGKTSEERQGAIMGVLGSYASLGRIAGPPASGLAYDFNIFLPYLISGLLSAAGAIAMSISNRGSKKEKKRQRSQ